jgi:hypothetical protein
LKVIVIRIKKHGYYVKQVDNDNKEMKRKRGIFLTNKEMSVCFPIFKTQIEKVGSSLVKIAISDNDDEDDEDDDEDDEDDEDDDFNTFSSISRKKRRIR